MHLSTIDCEDFGSLPSSSGCGWRLRRVRRISVGLTIEQSNTSFKLPIHDHNSYKDDVSNPYTFLHSWVAKILDHCLPHGCGWRLSQVWAPKLCIRVHNTRTMWSSDSCTFLPTLDMCEEDFGPLRLPAGLSMTIQLSGTFLCRLGQTQSLTAVQYQL